MNYTGKQKFKISWDWNWNMEVEIDFDFPGIMDRIEGMVEFWTDWESRLDSNDGDYVKTFLQQLGQKTFYLSQENLLIPLVKRFEYCEGYCKMEGSYGIRIIDADEFEIDTDEFEVKQIESNC